MMTLTCCLHLRVIKTRSATRAAAAFGAPPPRVAWTVGGSMFVVDIVAAAALIVALLAGVVRGFFASLGSIIGIIAGALLALWLVPLLTPAVSGIVPVGPWRSAALAILAVGTVLAVTAIGAAVGAAVRRGVDRTPLKRVERLAGGAVTFVVTGLALLAVG
ncbi:MAG: hypothetical protein EOO67_20630, partial [Microbacterium sp.]